MNKEIKSTKEAMVVPLTLHINKKGVIDMSMIAEQVIRNDMNYLKVKYESFGLNADNLDRYNSLIRYCITRKDAFTIGEWTVLDICVDLYAFYKMMLALAKQEAIS